MSTLSLLLLSEKKQWCWIIPEYDVDSLWSSNKERCHNYSAVSETAIQSTRTLDCVSVRWPPFYCGRSLNTSTARTATAKTGFVQQCCINLKSVLQSVQVNKTRTHQHCTYKPIIEVDAGGHTTRDICTTKPVVSCGCSGQRYSFVWKLQWKRWD